MAVTIIESPNKIKKIKEYAGGVVFATAGHFKDLPSDEMGVDKEFNPKFVFDSSKKENIAKMIDFCKGQDVYIASDPDREGYAIGYMVFKEIEKAAKNIYRAEIREITEKGVRESLANAIKFTQTNQNLFNAFLGRRIGDRLVGYCLSPEASRALNDKYSVGRVQSPAVRLIVDREREIENFNKLPREQKVFFEIELSCEKEGKTFTAKYPKKWEFAAKEEAEELLNSIGNTAKIAKIETKQTEQNPKAPFDTVNLQASAANRLNISPETTMKIAQGLFEKGFITYMRTDSARLSDEFIDECSVHLRDNFQKRQFKSKNSQADAHEAIRPTHLNSDISELSEQEKTLYDLILKQTLASQAKPAIFDKTEIEIDTNGHIFKTSGRVQKEAGYLLVLSDEEPDAAQEEQILPPMSEGEELSVTPSLKEKSKNAPGRFKEATLVKELEKRGIGRPSTYASIIATIKARNYVEIQKKNLVPTNRGYELVDFLSKNDSYKHVLDYDFTANLEKELDEVEAGKKSYKEVMKNLCAALNIEVKEQAAKQKQPPTEKQIAFAQKIADEKKIKIPKVALEDKFEMMKFLDKNAGKKGGAKK